MSSAIHTTIYQAGPTALGAIPFSSSHRDSASLPRPGYVRILVTGLEATRKGRKVLGEKTHHLAKPLI